MTTKFVTTGPGRPLHADEREKLITHLSAFHGRGHRLSSRALAQLNDQDLADLLNFLSAIGAQSIHAPPEPAPMSASAVERQALKNGWTLEEFRATCEWLSKREPADAAAQRDVDAALNLPDPYEAALAARREQEGQEEPARDLRAGEQVHTAPPDPYEPALSRRRKEGTR